jgi:hypothetical protein
MAPLEGRTAIKPPAPEPKITLPPLLRELVNRKRPQGMLPDGAEAGVDPLVTVVCAPPGFGKATLVSSWVHNLRRASVPARVAWVNVDESDNDPSVLWPGIVAAINAAAEPPDARTLPAHCPRMCPRRAGAGNASLPRSRRSSTGSRTGFGWSPTTSRNCVLRKGCAPRGCCSGGCRATFA